MMMAQRRLAEAEELLLLAAQKGDSVEIERAKRAYRALGVLRNKAHTQKDTITMLVAVLRQRGDDICEIADRVVACWDQLQEFYSQLRIIGFMVERLAYPVLGKQIRACVDNPDYRTEPIVTEFKGIVRTMMQSTGDAGGIPDSVITKCKQLEQIRADLVTCDEGIQEASSTMQLIEGELRTIGHMAEADRLEGLRRPAKAAAMKEVSGGSPLAGIDSPSNAPVSPGMWFKRSIPTGVLTPLNEISIPKDKAEDGSLALELLSKLNIHDPMDPLPEVIEDEVEVVSNARGLWKTGLAAVCAEVASDKMLNAEVTACVLPDREHCDELLVC